MSTLRNSHSSMQTLSRLPSLATGPELYYLSGHVAAVVLRPASAPSLRVIVMLRVDDLAPPTVTLCGSEAESNSVLAGFDYSCPTTWSAADSRIVRSAYRHVLSAAISLKSTFNDWAVSF